MNDSIRINKSKRYLPHWCREGSTAIYWITFRLADSLPKLELDALNEERERFYTDHPKPWTEKVRNNYTECFPARIEAWLGAGHGSCVLAKPEIRQHLIDALLKFDGERHDFISGVIMPNHVHLLLRLRSGTELGALLKGIKGTSAKWINKAIDTTGKPLWMDESYDHIVRTREELEAFKEYVRKNPIHLDAHHYWLEEREIAFKLISDPQHRMLFAVDENT